jgi:hypothetical protein
MQNGNEFIYTPKSTSIELRWRKLYGYVPASEQQRYIKKWADFRALFGRTLDDVETPQPEGILQWKKWSSF